ncbi:keratin-associated protein 10-7 [Drosophila kikkawai]|uniref:Keratin-associated protein 10-7 n=1 Tax=Drosophila kikkawai TaxID=30033 RepID=A0A6P4J2N2_DROKI|nr:major surface-labeled trophozoite antigen 417 [Drosophila kikkawai]
MRGLNLIIAVITTLVVTQLDSSLGLQCLSCSSTDANCLTNPSSVTGVDCSSNNCFTATAANGTVSRGCLPDGQTTCTDSTSCQICNTDKCNTNTVCYKCTGESCNTVTDAMLAVCSTDTSKCYTTGWSATNMTRSCTADTTQTYKCPADATDPSCSICSTAQCNKVAYQREEGSCITCPNCVEAQEASAGQACTILYNQTFTGCYTTTAGARGCLNNLEGGCTDATTCQSCTANNCNTAAGPFKCIACLSNEVSGCWTGEGTELPSVDCANGTCFSGVWNGLGVRNCITAGSELMQYQCINKVEPYRCQTCTTSLCNKDSFNGSGSLSQMGVVGLFLGLLVVLRSA